MRGRTLGHMWDSPSWPTSAPNTTTTLDFQSCGYAYAPLAKATGNRVLAGFCLNYAAGYR